MITLITAQELSARIDRYFKYIKGEYHTEKKSLKGAKNETELSEIKVWDREAEPALLTGLALFLGFNSRQAFEDYERKGPHAALIKYARLKVEAEYEKKLHQQSPTGAIFALKSFGWNDKPDNNPSEEIPVSLRIEIVGTGLKPAASEREVMI